MKRRATFVADARDHAAIREAAIQRTVLRIPRGRVATYGQVAAAAGFPGYHRLVARVLRSTGDRLRWHRVVGAGGKICVDADSAREQRMRLEMEGVRFRADRVLMDRHQYTFPESTDQAHG